MEPILGGGAAPGEGKGNASQNFQHIIFLEITSLPYQILTPESAKTTPAPYTSFDTHR